MHLVDLQVGADKGIHLELHPRLTVIQAGTKIQERIASLLGRAYVLAGSEVSGTADGGGYLTPFDPTAVVALDLDGDGLDVIGPSDLPPPDPASHEAARLAALAETDRRSEELRQRSVERDNVSRLHEATRAAVDSGTKERADALLRLAELDEAVASSTERSPELDDEHRAAVAATEAARLRLEELRSVRAELADALGPSEDGSHLRIGDDTTELATLILRVGALGGLRPGDPGEIEAWLTGLRDGTTPIRADAAALAVEVNDVESAWQQAASLGIEGDPEVVRLAAERADIGENHELLLGLAESGLLGETAKSQIDAAHVAVVQAVKSDEAAAVEAQAQVLARYGFDSYLEYTIATSTRSVGQAVESKLIELVSRVDDLDAALVAARTAAADHLDRLATAREPAQQKVTEFLGYRPAGSSLDHLARVPQVPVPVTRLTVTVDDAIDAAVEELQHLRDAVVDLEAERTALEERSAELAERRSGLSSRIAELDSVLSRAETEAVTLSERLRRAEAAEADAAEMLSTASSEVNRLDELGTLGYTHEDIAHVVDSLVERIEPKSETGDPVLLHDTFERFDGTLALAALEVLTSRIEHGQVIYLTGDRAIAVWARTLDPTVGRFIAASQGRWSPRRFGRKVLGRV